MTGAIGGAGNVYLYPEFNPGFHWVPVAQSLVFCVVFCRSLFVLFLLTIVLYVLRFFRF